VIANDAEAVARARRRARIVEQASLGLLGSTMATIRNRRRLAVVTLELHDSGEIAIPVQRGARNHARPRRARYVPIGERR